MLVFAGSTWRRLLRGALALALFVAAALAPIAAQAQDAPAAEASDAARGPTPLDAVGDPLADAPSAPTGAPVVPAPVVLAPADRIAEFDRAAAVVERLARRRNAPAESLAAAREALIDQRGDALALAEELRAELNPLRAQAEELGPEPAEADAEAPELTARRAALIKRIADLEALLRAAGQAEARADALATLLAERQRERFADKLLEPGANLFSLTVLGQGLAQLADLAARGVGALWTNLAPFGGGLIGAVAALIALLVALWRPIDVLSAMALERLQARGERRAGVVGTLGYGAGYVVLKALPAVILGAPAILFATYATALDEPTAVLIARVGGGAVVVAVVLALARIVFSPSDATHRMIDLGDDGARRAVAQSVALAAIIVAMRAMLDPAIAAGASAEAMSVATAIAVCAAAPLFFNLVRLVGRRPPEAPEKAEDEDEGDLAGGLFAALRTLGLIVALAAPAAALFGYPNLARFLTEKSAFTLLILTIAGLVFTATARAMPDSISIDMGGGDPKAEGRRSASVAAGGLLRAAVGLALVLALAPALAFLWGVSGADLRDIWLRLLDGVDLGPLRISLIDIGVLIGVATLGLWITRLLQKILRRAVFRHSRLDQGLQTSLSAFLGYFGVLATGVVAVSAVGLDLSNLAIVAGALSVGVGFGLQAVVNNFVSGLILLVERPVKVGDWIVVGEDQGYVRRINVRSTEIETFDRSHVIVPNSELISGRVTNMTHHNMTGRLILPVGVGYDSDPDQVLKILREAALAHPQVLRYPSPLTLFMGFGDSALDFELRVYLRDVNSSLSARSELNIDLLKRLRAAEIEIPFPQRDLHLKSGPPAAPTPAEPALDDEPARTRRSRGAKTEPIGAAE